LEEKDEEKEEEENEENEQSTSPLHTFVVLFLQRRHLCVDFFVFFFFAASFCARKGSREVK
jgi:hypothetical protein